MQEQSSEAPSIPTDITDYIEKIDQDEDEEEASAVLILHQLSLFCGDFFQY